MPSFLRAFRHFNETVRPLAGTLRPGWAFLLPVAALYVVAVATADVVCE